MDKKKMMYKDLRIHQLRRWHFSNTLKDQEQLYYGQLPILEYIKENPGCKQKDIADKFALSRATITKSVKRMLKNDVISRSVDEDDERKFQLFISQRGSTLVENARKVFDAVDDLTFKGFSDEEKELLCNFYERMADNLETDYSRNSSLGKLRAEVKAIEEGNKK